MKNIRTIFLITGSFLCAQNAAIAQTNQSKAVAVEKVSLYEKTEGDLKYEQLKELRVYESNETKAGVKPQSSRPDNNTATTDKNKVYALENPTNNTQEQGKRYYALDENGNIMGAEKMDQNTIQKLKDEAESQDAKTQEQEIVTVQERVIEKKDVKALKMYEVTNEKDQVYQKKVKEMKKMQIVAEDEKVTDTGPVPANVGVKSRSDKELGNKQKPTKNKSK